ncbi:MAG: hypothetical protein MMC23_005795 [Stictis urceolatum]|nr:hypothetical protein [Stictis urceolata]
MSTTYQQDRPVGRPRTKSMLSFSSHRSSGSVGKSGKMDPAETQREKTHRRMTSKNDPNLAMKEMQPGQAALEQTTIDSLRGIQHKDMHGNVITDPDRSNPTRPRLERPLDTIRAFEAAIDGSYNKRSSMIRPESRDGFQSRRSSYYQGFGNHQARFNGEGGYHDAGGYSNGFNGAGRMGQPRPESYNDGYNRSSPAPFRDSRRMSTRNHSDPVLYGSNRNGNYPPQNHHYQHSYDAATTGSGSGSYGTEPWGNSTDPSSENSSVDKIPQPPKPDLAEQYGFTGFGGAPEFRGPIIEEVSQDAPAYGHPGYGQRMQGYGQQGYPPVQNGRMGGHGGQGNDLPPPPPPHKQGASSQGSNRLQSARKPSVSTAPLSVSRSDTGEKRKSWLKRRFSKNA